MSARVGVIIPCYNMGEYLRQTIESVQQQTFKDFEIVVVNDGSTDQATNNLLAKLNYPKTKVIQTENQGLAQARNNGIKATDAELILPLDADDLLYPTHLEKLVTAYDEHKGDIVYSEAEYFGAKTGKWELPAVNVPDMLVQNCVYATALYNRSAWDKVGGYDPQFRFYEDFDFWLSQIEQQKKFYRVPEILFRYRIKTATDKLSEASILSIRQDKERETFAKLVQKHHSLYADNIAPLMDKLIYTLQESEARRLELIELKQTRGAFGKAKQALKHSLTRNS